MDSRAQDVSSQGQDDLAGQVMESVGEPAEAADQIDDSHGSDGQESHDPLYVQKRLKQQKRAHEREIRGLHSAIAEMQSRQYPPQSQDLGNPYGGGQMAGGVDEQIHKAVSYALQHRDMEESKAKQAQQAMHVQKQYGELHKHLDSTADKYDDFDEVVRGQEAPFTPHMRDASLFLPKTGPGSAGEVLYKLGKNPTELDRISKLHPLDQASEMVKLSHALISGGDQKSNQSPKIMGQVKTSPVTNSHVVTEKTPIGNIRERMKSGSWK